MAEDREQIELRCAACGGAVQRHLAWVQENTFFTCPQCGAAVLINKDEATKLFAEMQRRGD